MDMNEHITPSHVHHPVAESQQAAEPSGVADPAGSQIKEQPTEKYKDVL